MRQNYIYGLMIGFLFLTGCATKPTHRMHQKTPDSIIATAQVESSSPAAENSPQASKASWMNSTSETSVYRTGNPYKVNGVWHFPQKELDANHDEIGEATWYGHDFHNKMTANGEIFDMHGFTAAHKTLPLPSVVRVTNLSNKKSIILRVNDRGPFDNKRIIDVSKKAAELLGFLDQGSAKVRVQVLPEESMRVANMTKGSNYNPIKNTPAGNVAVSSLPAAIPPVAMDVPSSDAIEVVPPSESSNEGNFTTPTPAVLDSILPNAGDMASTSQPVETPDVVPVASSGTTFIQAGAYRSRANAENAIKRLQKVAPAELAVMNKDSNPLYRVRVGPFPDKVSARKKLKDVVSLGHPDATIVG